MTDLRVPKELLSLVDSITLAIDAYVDETMDNTSSDEVHFLTVSSLLTIASREASEYLEIDEINEPVNEKLHYAFNEIVNECMEKYENK